MPNLNRPGRRLWALLLSSVAASALLTGCGGGIDEATKTGAQSLQEAMDASSRAIDEARGTRSSLDNLASNLETAADQTSDVVGVLAAKDDDASQLVVAAAREQRTFLQQAERAASARSRGTAQTALTQTRAAARRATDAYTKAAREIPDLAGRLPASTTFNTGRLRDVVLQANPASKAKSSSSKSQSSSTSASSSSSSAGGATDCGGGVTANNANTTCPFARNVADAFRASGGDSVIDVWSPVTQRWYTMYCDTGSSPTVCTGGNNASVSIR